MSRVTVPACSAVAKIMHPGTIKYSQDFTLSTLDSWTNFDLRAPSYGHQAPGCASRNVPGAGTSTHSRAMTGLTIGRQYRLSAWAANTDFVAGAAGTLFSVGVSGIGSSTGVTSPLASALGPIFTFTRISYSFTATATSHTCQLTEVVTQPVGVFWDDIRLDELEYEVDSITLSLKPGSTITLDESRAPYAEAQLSIALPDQADLDLLDTRLTNTVRVQVTTAQTRLVPALSSQSRTFDLLLHHRDADHASSSAVTLICRSDEAKLIDAGNNTGTTVTAAVVDQKSLRAIVSEKLAQHFAVLESGTDDADFTITTALTNFIQNPGAEVDASNWYTSTGASAVARSTTNQYRGAASLRVTASANSCRWGAAASATAPIAVTPGRTYTFSVKLKSQVARNAHIELVWRDVNNNTISADSSTTALTSTTAFTEYTVTGVAPSNAAGVLPVLETVSNGVGQFHYADDAILTEGSYLYYFDGSFAADSYYSYAWEGTANVSRSLRIRLDSRDPLLLYQEPGEKDWDFLQQLVQVAGLRLFCDEARAWRLVDAATYAPSGTIVLTNPKRARDRISRDDGDWCNAVVVKYTWIGLTGATELAYDAATTGAGDCLLLIEWNRPYPGPGAADAVLARYQGRGRVQEITAGPDLTVKPGMALETSLPNTPDQEGYVSSVTLRLDVASIEMTVAARGLVDA